MIREFFVFSFKLELQLCLHCGAFLFLSIFLYILYYFVLVSAAFGSMDRKNRNDGSKLHIFTVFLTIKVIAFTKYHLFWIYHFTYVSANQCGNIERWYRVFKSLKFY